MNKFRIKQLVLKVAILSYHVYQIPTKIKSKSVTLKEEDKKIVKLNFDGFKYLGIWAPIGAPFICLEPWYTTADYVDSRKGKTESFKRSRVNESASKKIPYDLVSSFVILRDYADVNDSCVSDEHRDLVDIADSIYNADISVSDMSKKYQDVYKKYGKAYFDKVLKDIRAIDSQIDRTSINDLVAEVNDKLSAF